MCVGSNATLLFQRLRTGGESVAVWSDGSAFVRCRLIEDVYGGALQGFLVRWVRWEVFLFLFSVFTLLLVVTFLGPCVCARILRIQCAFVERQR